MDRASDYGSEGWEFKSLRARHLKIPPHCGGILFIPKIAVYPRREPSGMIVSENFALVKLAPVIIAPDKLALHKLAPSSVAPDKLAPTSTALLKSAAVKSVFERSAYMRFVCCA